MSESYIVDAAGGRRPVRHLDPDRVRRSPGATRVQDTTYVADRLIVRGDLPASLRESLASDVGRLTSGGQDAVVALDEWTQEGEPSTWLDGVRRIATEMGYRAVYDGTLGDLAVDDVEDETFGYALRLLPARDDDVEVDVWQVIERITGELGDLDQPDPDDEGERPAPRVALDHVLRSCRGKSTPLPFVPVARPKSTPLPVSAIDEYGRPGSGGLAPVRYLGGPPHRTLPNGPTPWVAADGTRRPAVAIVDTGVGSHDWFGPYHPHRPQDSSVVVRTAVLDDGRPIGTFPVPQLISEDPEHGGLSVDPLTGPLDPVAGHGTFMAGIVHQVCPDAVIVAVRAFGGSGDIPEWQVLHTLWRLLRFHRRGAAGHEGYHPIDVAVLAMGYYHEQPEDYGYDGPLRRVLRALRRAGVVVVVASGNDGTTRPMFPAAWAPHVVRRAAPERTDGGTTAPVPVDDRQLSADHPPLLVAGATNPDGTTAVFSNDGPWVTCVRPGAAVVSTMPTTIDGPETPQASLPERLRPGTRASVDPDDFTGGFATWSGTSFAAPYLAAQVAAARLKGARRAAAQAEPVSAAWDAVTTATHLSGGTTGGSGV